VVTPKNVTAPDYDVEKGITTMIDLLKQHNVINAMKHVKGHQYRNEQSTLSKEARMNLKANKDAKLAMKTHSYSTA
jgi:ribonuclease HI